MSKLKGVAQRTEALGNFHAEQYWIQPRNTREKYNFRDTLDYLLAADGRIIGVCFVVAIRSEPLQRARKYPLGLAKSQRAFRLLDSVAGCCQQQIATHNNR